MVGVSMVLFLDANDASGVEQIYKDIVDNLSLQSTLETISSFHIEDEVYYNPNSQNFSKYFTIMKNSDYPETCFVFTDNKNPVIADINFLSLVEKFKSYPQKKNSKSDIIGKKFRLSDFYITVSKLSIGPSTANTKGVFVEFEYLPSNSPIQCVNLILEFINGMFSEYWPKREEVVQKSLQAIPNFNFSNKYIPMHTMQQYMEHIKLFRKIN